MNDADWDCWVASYICCGSLVVLARHSSVVIYVGFEFCVWGLWYPVCVCCDLFSTTSIDSVGHAPAAIELLQQIVVSTQLICVVDRKCAVWAEAPSVDATTSHGRQPNVH